MLTAFMVYLILLMGMAIIGVSYALDRDMRQLYRNLSLYLMFCALVIILGAQHLLEEQITAKGNMEEKYELVE